MRNLVGVLISAATLTALIGTTVTKNLPGTESGWAPNQNGYLKAGTLSIEVERGGGDTVGGPLYYPTPLSGQTPGGEPGLFPTGPLAPGDTVHRVLVIRNTGTLEAVLDRVWAEAQVPSPLADQLHVRMTSDAAGQDDLVWGTLYEFLTQPQFLSVDGIVLAPGAERELHVWVHLPLSTGNAYQGMSITVDFGFHAEQRGKQRPRPPKPPGQLG